MGGASKGRSKLEMNIGCMLQAPQPEEEEVESDLLSQLGMAARKGNVIIMGDFNYPELDLADGAAHSLKARHFFYVLQDNFMSQFVDSPTGKNALQDLLITNNSDLVADVEIQDNLGTSNHRINTFRINHYKILNGTES